jgi:hypothetical protein
MNDSCKKLLDEEFATRWKQVWEFPFYRDIQPNILLDDFVYFPVWEGTVDFIRDI